MLLKVKSTRLALPLEDIKGENLISVLKEVLGWRTLAVFTSGKRVATNGPEWCKEVFITRPDPLCGQRPAEYTLFLRTITTTCSGDSSPHPLASRRWFSSPPRSYELSSTATEPTLEGKTLEYIIEPTLPFPGINLFLHASCTPDAAPESDRHSPSRLSIPDHFISSSSPCQEESGACPVWILVVSLPLPWKPLTL